jgi:hypothetical protein
METEKQKETVTGNVTSELTDGKINSLNAMYGKFSENGINEITKIALEKYNNIVEQIFSKLSKPKVQIALLENITDALTEIFKIDKHTFAKTKVDVYATDNENCAYFDIHIPLPAGIPIRTIVAILNAKYRASLYWVESLSLDIALQFVVSVKNN